MSWLSELIGLMHLYNLQDGHWHMITLTTLPGTAGFAMYLDGVLAGELNTTTGAACIPCDDQIPTAFTIQCPIQSSEQICSALTAVHDAPSWQEHKLWTLQFWVLASCPWMAATPWI